MERTTHPEMLVMTRIRAICPTCGEIELQPSDVTLLRRLDGDGRLLDGSTYRFVCPGCVDLVEKPADERVVSLLTSGGVAVEDVVRPVRALHPEFPDDGPALTLDDLLDLHLALADPCWFDRLAALTPR